METLEHLLVNFVVVAKVVGTARNDVDVDVIDRLPGCLAVLHRERNRRRIVMAFDDLRDLR